MKRGIILLFVFLRLSVQSLPLNDADPRSTCIDMTPLKEVEIEGIIEDINSFIQSLSDEHDDINFKLVKVIIENNPNDDLDEKVTTLNFVINDCENNRTRHRTKYIEPNDDLADNTAESDNSDETSEAGNTNEGDEDTIEGSGNTDLNTQDDESDVESLGSDTASISQVKDSDDKSLGSSNTAPVYKDDDKNIGSLINNFKDVNWKNIANKEKGVVIFAPTIDNHKVDITNHNDELYKDLYNLALQKVLNLENELQKVKQAKYENVLASIQPYECFRKLLSKNSAYPNHVILPIDEGIAPASSVNDNKQYQMIYV